MRYSLVKFENSKHFGALVLLSTVRREYNLGIVIRGLINIADINLFQYLITGVF